jgi:hypothetical protein
MVGIDIPAPSSQPSVDVGQTSVPAERAAGDLPSSRLSRTPAGGCPAALVGRARPTGCSSTPAAPRSPERR